MLHLYVYLSTFVQDEGEGQGMAEYGLILALVAVVAHCRIDVIEGRHRWFSLA